MNLQYAQFTMRSQVWAYIKAVIWVCGGMPKAHFGFLGVSCCHVSLGKALEFVMRVVPYQRKPTAPLPREPL